MYSPLFPVQLSKTTSDTLLSGKISNISVTQTSGAQTAAVTFEKPTAAKTALLLDNTQLGPNLVSVTSASSSDDISSYEKSAPSSSFANTTTGESSDEVDQEDKPRGRIIAEYLAHGYAISDNVVGRALDLDQQHGYSSRFTQALQQFDDKYHATDNAKNLDARLGVSEKAGSAWQGLNSYFEKAMGTQSGQKVRDFYNGSSQQVLDVHTEARRLADLKGGKTNTHVEGVPGTDMTKCNCGADSGKCPCEPGKCACSNCGKSGAAGEKTQYA